MNLTSRDVEYFRSLGIEVEDDDRLQKEYVDRVVGTSVPDLLSAPVAPTGYVIVAWLLFYGVFVGAGLWGLLVVAKWLLQAMGVAIHGV